MRVKCDTRPWADATTPDPEPDERRGLPLSSRERIIINIEYIYTLPYIGRKE